jgi:hypothetical protein
MDDRRIVKTQTPEKRVTSRRLLPDLAGGGQRMRTGASAETLTGRFQACGVQAEHDEACAKAEVFE